MVLILSQKEVINMSEEIEKLGTCPVCGKGQIVKGSLGYSCNYFKNMNDKCTFNIYHSYFEKEITKDIALQLIEKGETDVFYDLRKKDTSIFSASLKIEDGLVKPHFSNEVLENPCPVCGGKVESLLNGYACENYIKKDGEGNRVCNLYIPKTICERSIPIQAAELLIQGKRTPFMTGFKASSGNEFSTRLVLTENLNISFDNTLCKCPKCGGTIYMNKKAYNCSNYRDESIKCDFVIWREMMGREISPEEAIQICEKGETDILSGFHDKDGNPLERKLTLNEEYKVKLI